MNRAPLDASVIAARLWRKDATLWQTPPDTHAAIAARLGWLDCAAWLDAHGVALQAWANRAVDCGAFDRAIVLGMGGSSMAARVFAALFAPRAVHLQLEILDSTQPAQIARIASRDLRRCLFVVAGKSGETIETLDLFAFFYAQLRAQCSRPGARFVVITDRDSRLHALGDSLEVSQLFFNPPDIGGRYSALSYFGLAPAALLGVELTALGAHLKIACAQTQAAVANNPALQLGQWLGQSASAHGRDKLRLYLPESLRAFGMWIEQLVAESTGKQGRGIVPVLQVGDRHSQPPRDDCIDVAVAHPTQDADWRAPPHARRLVLADAEQIGGAFFDWQFAVAVACAYLRVNPFDQPDVAASKSATRAFIQQRSASRNQPNRDAVDLPPPQLRTDKYALTLSRTLSRKLSRAADPSKPIDAHRLLMHFQRSITPQCYLAALSYLPESRAITALLHELCARAGAQLDVVATLGVGPRYLHSTGQLHKGGANRGRFIQLCAPAPDELRAPERDYTFGELLEAQADGDFAVLAERGVIMRVALKTDTLESLRAFVDAFCDAANTCDSIDGGDASDASSAANAQ